MNSPRHWYVTGQLISQADRLHAEEAASGCQIWIEARVEPEPEAGA